MRIAAEQAAQRAEQEFLDQEMQKVVVKSLDDGGSIKAVELTASPVIGAAELMKKQASQMQVRSFLSVFASLLPSSAASDNRAPQANIREANRFGDQAEAQTSIDHTGSLFIKCLDDGQVRKVKDVEKSIDVVGTPVKGKGEVEECDGLFSGVGLVLWQSPSGLVFIHRCAVKLCVAIELLCFNDARHSGASPAAPLQPTARCWLVTVSRKSTE